MLVTGGLGQRSRDDQAKAATIHWTCLEAPTQRRDPFGQPAQTVALDGGFARIIRAGRM